jgi:hypothetical protein
MKRKEFNNCILVRCIELLRSRLPSENYEGAILSAYLIEQSFKSELKKVNPLLVFDRRNISDDKEMCIALGNLSKEELSRLKTSTPKRCIAQMCEYKTKIAACRANLEELFDMRNLIVHSTDELPLDANSIAETAVSALRACARYIIKHSGINVDKFNPLTSKEFEQLQERKLKKRISDIKKTLMKHRKIFKALSQPEITNKFNTNVPKTDNYTWIEETIQCPACSQSSLDKVGMVDFDWNPDGIISSGGYSYHCRVCELALSEYEYEIVCESL